MAITLYRENHGTIEALEEKYPDRIMNGHGQMEAPAKHAVYLATLYGGPRDAVRVRVDATISGSSRQFVIEGVLWCPYDGPIGPIEESGIRQKEIIQAV